jgi:hypothetical protein
MKKTEITYHGIGYGAEAGPAVNVKIHASPTNALALDVTRQYDGEDPRFTLDWIDAHLSEGQRNGWWEDACRHAWEQLQNDVNTENVFDRSGKVEIISEGRSGGWAIVRGWTRDTVTGWDAVAVARWGKFARYARETANDVPFQYLAGIYLNVFEDWARNQDEAATYL